jgi:hypothetical protein
MIKIFRKIADWLEKMKKKFKMIWNKIIQKLLFKN